MASLERAGVVNRTGTVVDDYKPYSGRNSTATAEPH